MVKRQIPISTSKSTTIEPLQYRVRDPLGTRGVVVFCFLFGPGRPAPSCIYLPYAPSCIYPKLLWRCTPCMHARLSPSPVAVSVCVCTLCVSASCVCVVCVVVCPFHSIAALNLLLAKLLCACMHACIPVCDGGGASSVLHVPLCGFGFCPSRPLLR